MSPGCPVCSGPGSSTLWQGRGRGGIREIRRCDACAAAFAHPLPDDAELSGWYDEEYFTAYYGGDRSAAERRDEDLLRHAAQRTGGKGRLLDIGCGVGDLCVAAQRLGWQAAGIEQSQEAVGRARERGVEVTQGEAAHLLQDDAGALAGPFDLVVLKDALPHMPRAGRVLAGAVGRLRRGGWLLLRVPNRHPGIFFAAGLAGWITDPSGVLHLPAQILHLDRNGAVGVLTHAGLRQVAVEPHTEGVGTGGGRYSRNLLADRLWRLLVAHWERLGEPESLLCWGRRG